MIIMSLNGNILIFVNSYFLVTMFTNIKVNCQTIESNAPSQEQFVSDQFAIGLSEPQV